MRGYENRRAPLEPAKEPKAWFVDIACDESHVRGDLTDGFWKGLASRKLAALEMESFSLFSVALRRATRVIFAKGVMDHGTQEKDDQWKIYAAQASAAWIRYFLEHADW